MTLCDITIIIPNLFSISCVRKWSNIFWTLHQTLKWTVWAIKILPTSAGNYFGLSTYVTYIHQAFNRYHRYDHTHRIWMLTSQCSPSSPSHMTLLAESLCISERSTFLWKSRSISVFCPDLKLRGSIFSSEFLLQISCKIGISYCHDSSVFFGECQADERTAFDIQGDVLPQNKHMKMSKLRAWKNTRSLTVPYHETWILLHCTHIEVVNILFPIIFIQQIVFPKDPSFHKRNCTIPRIHCPHSTFHSFEWQSSAKTRTELRPSTIQVLSHVKLKHPTQTTALVPDADRPGYFFGVKFPHDMPSNNIGESHVYYIYIIYIIYTYLRNQHPKVLSVYSITQTWRQIRHIWKWDCTRHYNKLWRGLADDIPKAINNWTVPTFKTVWFVFDICTSIQIRFSKPKTRCNS